MASTYSTNLALELIGTGDQAGTWGNTTNTNLGTLIEQAISGYVTQAVSTGTDTTITIPNGSTGVARNMYIELTGTGGTNTNLIVPANKKLYFIFNNSTGAVTVKVSGQTGVSVPAGKKMVLVSNGTDIVNGLNYIADFGTNSFTVTNLTATSASITTLTSTSATITNLTTTSLTLSNNPVLSGGTANGVLYLNASKVATSGSALVFDGTNLGIGRTPSGYTLDITTGGNALRMERSGVEMGGFISGGNPFWGTITNHPFLFMTNATERMRLDASGNLGIGTSSPAGKLDVVGSNSRVRWDLSNSYVYQAATNTAASAFASAYYDGSSHQWLIASAARMVLDGSGNVGIGTSSPGEKLNVVGGNNTTSTVNFTGGSNNDNATIASDYSLVFQVDANNTVGGRVFNWRYGGNGYEGGTSLMTLNSSGNLGLGVTPSAWSIKALQVNNSSIANDSNDTYIQSNAFFDGSWKYINSAEAAQYYQVNGSHVWRYAASGTAGNTISFTQAMTLDASGNLGIGITNPADRLSVYIASGDAQAAFGNSTRTNYVGTQGSTYGALAGGDLKLYASGGNAVTLMADNASGIIKFATGGNTERARITSGGYFKASNSGTYDSSTGTYHEFYRDTNTAADTLVVKSACATATNQYGINTLLAGDPNDAARYFFQGAGAANVRFVARSNGGLANYQANDANLSDQRVKKDVKPLGSMWDKFKAIEIVTFKYKDQTHDDDNIGVIAQQVESVAPEFIDVDGFGETPEDGVPLKTVYTTDMYHAAIKALQEAMARIEFLEAKVAALEAK